MKKFVESLAMAFLCLLVCLWTSCEIGLGSAVDTQPPSIEISNPPTAAIIRDEFAIRGNWSDDGTIKSLKVTLSATSSDISIDDITFDGTVITTEEGKGTWTCTINPLSSKKPIPDGEYEAKISITDAGEHVTTSTRSFVIDNTAPLVILNRPSSKVAASSSNTDSYGQTFTLEGQTADDNDVASLLVNFYDNAACTGDPLSSVTLTNVDKINHDVAKFVSGETNDYSKIYEEVLTSSSLKNATSKERYCTIVAYDYAQRYPVEGNQTAADTKGNCTTDFYLKSDISLLLSTYKAEVIYKMLNGTYSLQTSNRSVSSTEIESVKNQLSSNLSSTGKVGKFYLNPRNNPSVVVNSFTADVAAELTNNNNKLTFEISKGLDDYEILPDTFGAYIKKCDGNGVDLSGNDGNPDGTETWIIKPVNGIEVNGVTVSENQDAWDGRQTIKSGIYKFNSQYAIGSTNYKTLKVNASEANETYRIFFVGTDEKGNTIEPTGRFYFRIASSGASIDLSSNTTALILKHGGVTRQVKLTFGGIEYKKFHLYRTKKQKNADGSDKLSSGAVVYEDWTEVAVVEENAAVSTGSGTCTYDSETDRYTYTDEINPTSEEIPSNVNVQTYKYKVVQDPELGDAESNSKGLSVNVSMDDVAPVINFTTPAAITYSDVNHFEFEGTVTEDHIDSIKAELYKKGVKTSETTLSTDSESKWLWKLYDLADDSYTVKLTAVDKAGNQTEKECNTVVVDTVKPVVSVKGTNLYDSEGAAISSGTALDSSKTYYAKAAYTISGTITEANFESSTSKVYLTTTKNEGTETNPALTVNADGTWSFSGITTEDAKYKYILSVIDKAGNRNDTEIAVTYDTKVPVVEILTPEQGSYYTQAGTVAASGTLTDGIGIGNKALKYSEDGTTYTDMTLGTNWTQNISLTSEGTVKLYVKAIDKLGHESTPVERTFYFDKETPKIVLSPELSTYTKTNSITISGTAYDTNELAKITVKDSSDSSKVYSTYASEDSTGAARINITSGTVAQAKSDATKVSWKCTISDLSNGPHEFEVTATDIANRSYTISPAPTTTVDTVNPTITFTTSNLPTANDTLNTSFTFGGEASDAESGVKQVELTISNSDKSVSKTVTARGTTIWSTTVEYNGSDKTDDTDGTQNSWAEVFAAEGTKYVKAKVTDKAGLSAESSELSFIYDKAKPSLVISNLQDSMSSSGFTVKGTASDSLSAYDKLTLTIKETYTANGTTTYTAPADPVTITIKSDASWSQKLPLNGDAQSGTYKYEFILKDEAEQSTNIVSSEISVDTNPPTNVTITSPSESTTGKNAVHEESYKFEGTAEDNGSGDSGLSAVYYKVVTKGSTAPDVSSITDNLDNTLWTAKGFTKATVGSTSWNDYCEVKSDASGIGGQGSKTMYVYAVDKAGNRSSVATRDFDVDMSDPTVETYISDSKLEVSTTQVQTGAYTFKFKVDDTYGLDSTSPYTVSVKKNNAALTAGDNGYSISGPDSDKKYTITITGTAAGDALYEYTITAKDKVGKTTSVIRNIRLDTKAPSLSILTPDLSSYQNAEKVTVKGSAEDDSGTLAVWYAYGVASAPTVPQSDTTSDSSWTTNWAKASGTTSWTIADLAGVEGTAKNLYVCAVDSNGLVSSVESRTVKIDLSNPTSTTDETSLITNTSFNFTGTAYDINGLNSVTVVQSGVAAATYSTDSSEEATPSVVVTVPSGKTAQEILAAAKDAGSKASWTKAFTITKGRTGGAKSGELSDGEYAFSIKVKDAAGKETIKSRTVTIDTIAPDITTNKSTLTWSDSPATGASHTVRTATLTVTPTDTNLDSVYYFVNDGSDTTITGYANVPANKWETIIPSSGVYSKDVSFSDGSGSVYIKVTDKAGNASYDTSISYSVDTTNPEKPVLTTVDGSALSGTKMINGSAAVTFKLTAKDQNDNYVAGVKTGLDVTKVASVNLSHVGTAAVTPTSSSDGKGTATLENSAKTGEWTISIPTSAFASLSAGSQSIYVTVTDTSGNAEEYEMFSIELDNVKPVPAITSPVAATINGTLEVTGTVTENYPASVGLYYRTSAPSSSDNSNTTIAGWTKISEIIKGSGTNSATTTYTTSSSDINKFTFASVDFNTLSGANASTQTDKKHDIYLLVYSTDTAGNASLVSKIENSVTTNYWKQFCVDMDEDRPVVKFSNITLGSAMSSSSRVGFENSELYGSVTDDDGVPETVKYFIGAAAPAANASTWISPAANSNFVYSNGSFTLKFLDSNGRADDGEKNIFFKVTDKAGNTFISTASTTYDSSSVKVSDGTNVYGARPASGTTKASAVYIKVDTQAPDVYNEGYYLGATASTDDTNWSNSIAAATFGGTQNQFYLRQFAHDANNVSSVKVHIPTEEGDVTTGTGAVSGYANTSDATKPSVTGYYEYNFTQQTGTNSSVTLNGTEYIKWVSSLIDVKGMKSGTRSSEIIVSDGIKTKTTTVNITIDNNAPTVNVESHSANEQLRSSFLMKGTFTDGDQGTQLWYKLSTSATTPTSWSSSTVSSTTAINWRIAFDGDENPQDAYTHDGVPKQIIANLLDTVEIASSGTNAGKAVWKKAGTAGGETHSAGDLYTTITTIYFHFKVQDRLGNESTAYIPLKLDPQGDVPVITLVSPDSTQTTLGGTVRFSGSAEDDNSIAGLYIEVDPQYVAANGFVPWSSTHKTPSYTKNGSTVTGKAPSDILTTANYPNNTYELINAKVADAKKKTTTVYGIYIGNALSWNIALNKYGEWNGAATNTVAVRFYAVDVDGNMSLPTDPFVFQVDSDKPKIGNTVSFYLKKYSDNSAGTGTVTASVEYTDGIWLKGEWWLEGSVEDENGIETVTMNNADIKSSSTAKTKGSGTNQWPNTSGYITHYKVGNSTADLAANLEYTLSITDGDSKTNEKVFSINYDNKAPTLAATTDDNYSISTTVKNSNGFYTVRSAVVEGSGESGFDKVVFYFKRTSSGYQNVYDSYMAKTYTNASDVKVNTSNQFAYSDLTYDSYLYWKTATLSAVSGNLITISAKDENIHVGGLIKVDGTIYTISAIDNAGTGITLSGNPSESATGTIYYAIGHVVDHAGAESAGTSAGKITTANSTNKGYGYGYYGNSPDDDGDKMIETVSTSGTQTIWSASINSNNIPDGPIELHYVAFDKAGNISHGVVGASSTDYTDAQVADGTTAKVSNNAPRLAGVTIWSDFNGDGTGWRSTQTNYENETKSKYYSRVRPNIGGKATERSKDVTSKLIVSSNDYGIKDTTAGTAYMKVTDTVKFIPEIVGGNGQLYYDYKIGKASAFTVDSNLNITGFTASTTTGSKALSGGSSSSNLPLQDDSAANVSGNDEGDNYPTTYDESTTLTYVSGHTEGVITFDAATFLANLDNSTAADPTWFDVRIWDSTEGGTPYTNTLNCEMQVALMNVYNDKTAPKAWIRPFYWTKSGKPSSGNDLYNSISWDASGNALGHIELESDLSSTLTALTTGSSSTALGSDPKVSGQIVVEGYAYDDIKLKDLYAKFDTHSALGTNYVLINSYDSGTWANNKSGTGWSCTTEDVYCSADGHLAHWLLTIDTSKITNVADLDKTVTVFAVDKRGSATNTTIISGTTITGNNSYSDIPASANQTTVPFATWSAVKSNANAYTAYFTDPACTTAPVATTADTAVVYTKVPYYKMDVVPYITGISTPDRTNSGLKDNNIRSASGKYSVIKGSTANFMTVSGFNLNATAARIVDTSTVTGAVTASSGVELTKGTVASDYTSVGVKNDGTKSGYLELIVNGIRTLNNVNNNNAHGSLTFTGGTAAARTAAISDYADMPNREADYYTTKNVQLTDDRYIRFFDMHKTGTKNGYYPVMIMDGDNPVFGYVDTNGCTDGTCTYIAACFQPQRRKFNGSTGATISTEYLCGGISWDQMAMAKDSAGRYFNVSVYNQNGGSMGLYYNQYASLYNNVQAGNANGEDSTYYNNVAWQLGTGYYGYNGNWSNSGNNNAITLDGMNAGSVLVDRYQNIKLIASGNSTTTTGANIYQAYYDDQTSSIIFRQLMIGKYSKNGTFKNKLYSGANKDSSITYAEGTNITENSSSNGYASGHNVVTSSGSKYYDFGIVTNGSSKYAVFVYYDYSVGRMKLMYSSGLNGTPTQSVTWTTSSIDLPNYVGQYVSMAVDGTSLHIAAFDANNSDLKYIYIPTYNGTSYTAMTVDAAGSVGNWTQIKIDTTHTTSSLYNKPVIAYYNSTETGGRETIKLAFANAVKGSVTDGIDSTTDYTSTGWEYMTVPSVDPAQGGSQKFQSVCLDFDSAGRPVVGYLGTNLEFGKWLDE